MSLVLILIIIAGGLSMTLPPTFPMEIFTILKLVKMFPNTIYPGWFLPEEGSHEEKLDVALLKTLEYCIPDIMPIPTVEA
jgi:hypothetical protein